jgi:hypothetical protein
LEPVTEFVNYWIRISKLYCLLGWSIGALDLCDQGAACPGAASSKSGWAKAALREIHCHLLPFKTQKTVKSGKKWSF